jgi:hypothetical protein
VNFGKGYASMAAENVPVLDYPDFAGSLFGVGAPPVPATVSFKVVWSGVNERVKIRNTDPVYGGFGGDFIYNRAQMEWSARVGDVSIVSDPIGTSSSRWAELGHERNGMFFS